MEKSFYWNEFKEEINNSLTKGQRVFDAGAGDGHWRNNITADVDYISMDLGVGDANVDYSHLTITGDLQHIPESDASFDAIICIQVLEHVPEPWIVLKEFSRILKKHGCLFLSLPHSVPIHQEPYDFYRYTKYGVKYLFENAGFNIEFIYPQLGNTSKISNDLRMTGNLLLTKNRFYGYCYKFIAKMLDLFFVSIDQKYDLYNDTTGYFIKATKK